MGKPSAGVHRAEGKSAQPVQLRRPRPEQLQQPAGHILPVKSPAALRQLSAVAGSQEQLRLQAISGLLAARQQQVRHGQHMTSGSTASCLIGGVSSSVGGSPEAPALSGCCAAVWEVACHYLVVASLQGIAISCWQQACRCVWRHVTGVGKILKVVTYFAGVGKILKVATCRGHLNISPCRMLLCL